jgi:integrase
VASVQKRPDGRWRARYRDAADKEHARHFARKVDAERWLDEVRSHLLRGSYVDPAAGRVLFADYARTWLQAQPHRAGTALLYERTLRLHVFPRIGDRPIGSIRRSEIQALVTTSGRTLAPKTVENHFRLIKAVFSAALEDQLIAVNPCRKIARQPVAASKVVPLTVDQVEKLVASTPAHYKALVITSVGTGLRQGEALGLRAMDVDFLRREVHVRHQLVSVPGVAAHLGPPKTASSLRTVPAPAFVLSALAEHLRLFAPGPFGMIFSNTRGMAVNRQSLHRSLAAAVRAAGLPAGITFHQLRHTYASLLIDGGESVTVVADRMGHMNANETLRTYSHLWPSSDDKTRQVLERAFARPDARVADLTVMHASTPQK